MSFSSACLTRFPRNNEVPMLPISDSRGDWGALCAPPFNGFWGRAPAEKIRVTDFEHRKLPLSPIGPSRGNIEQC